MQKKCKPNGMELAPIAEMQPFFYKKYNIFSNNMTKTSIYLL
jgi:hypothetical protein